MTPWSTKCFMCPAPRAEATHMMERGSPLCTAHAAQIIAAGERAVFTLKKVSVRASA